MNRISSISEAGFETQLRPSGIWSAFTRSLPEASAQSFASAAGAAPASSGKGMAELRAVPRHRTYKAARIAFSGGRGVITCIVRNLSEAGACLSVDSPIGIPESFNLVLDSGEASRMCRVIWRKAKLMGVAFC